MGHVRLGKNGASSSDVGWLLRPQNEICELALDGYAEPIRLLIKKGAGSRGTYLIERVIDDHCPAGSRVLIKEYQLGVLSSNLNYCLHLRMKSGRCLCLGYDLILAVYAEDIADQLAGTARGDSPMESRKVTDQPLQNISQDSHRLATGPSVPARYDTIPRVYDPDVETDRAHVYPQVDSAATDRLGSPTIIISLLLTLILAPSLGAGQDHSSWLSAECRVHAAVPSGQR
jgi:hypothetical protein